MASEVDQQICPLDFYVTQNFLKSLLRFLVKNSGEKEREIRNSESLNIFKNSFKDFVVEEPNDDNNDFIFSQ